MFEHLGSDITLKICVICVYEYNRMENICIYIEIYMYI